MNAETILDLREVAVPSRRDRLIVSIQGVDWTVRAGEFWLVGGPQGAGKSDLLFVLAGLAPPLSGHAMLFGQDMSTHFGDERLAHRLRAGLVFDDARLFHQLTIAENIALPARYHQNLHAEEVDSWVGTLLRATELTEFANHTPGMISGGWRRRAALARALALLPEVLFLENPLRGLDVLHASWWIRFVHQLWRGHELMGGRGLTVIATTDELQPWQKSGAQFATLSGGKFTVAGLHAPEDEVPQLDVIAAQEN